MHLLEWNSSHTLIPSSSFTRRIILTHMSGIFSKLGMSIHTSLNIFITLFLTDIPVSCYDSKEKLGYDFYHKMWLYMAKGMSYNQHESLWLWIYNSKACWWMPWKDVSEKAGGNCGTPMSNSSSISQVMVFSWTGMSSEDSFDSEVSYIQQKACHWVAANLFIASTLGHVDNISMPCWPWIQRITTSI